MLTFSPAAPLAPLTTLELGGPAERLATVRSEAELGEALLWARREEQPVTVLGGGSNVVIADRGLAGLVIRIALSGISASEKDGKVRVTAAAGESWDELVAWTVEQGWAGLECLSGIPGTVGATPIQNVGAYGQEVADTLVEVRTVEAASGLARVLPAGELGLAYRTSLLRRRPGEQIVTAVSFDLVPGGAPTLRYAELVRALGATEAPPALVDVRAAVLALRRGKSMVIDPSDPNRRSVGSFFVNPVVSPRAADEVAERAIALGMIAEVGEMPRFATRQGEVKLSAGWLIERAGFAKGYRRGTVGISSRHALALVHHGGGGASELLALAAEVRQGVVDRFGVLLAPEPVLLGFDRPPL